MEPPSQSVQPSISNTKDIESLLHKKYGLTVKSLKPLNGYEDRNYHAKVESEFSNPHIATLCVHGYLVKVVNAIDSNKPEFIMAQKLMMDHFNSHGITCQEEIKTVDGKCFSDITVEKEGEPITYVVSVRTFLPGTVVDNVLMTSSLAYDVGLLTAKIAVALQDFECPYHTTFIPLWNLDNFAKVKTVVHAVKDEAHRRAAEEVFASFESTVIPRKVEFRKGEIHGDLNEQNILVEETSKGNEICGVLDFQDGCHSYLVYDLAIAIAYMMMVSKTEVPILDVGGHMLAGYETLNTLTKAEREGLRTLVASRMVMSLVYGAYYNSLDPSNDYYLITQNAGWKSFIQFWQTNEEIVWTRWDEIIKSYANK